MIKINSRSSRPIYEQIINGIKENILKGILEPGEKLPSVREMSSLITANPNTVSKAYKELERQKVIETIRGRGTYVSSDYKPRLEEDRMKVLKEEIKKIIIEAHYMGIKKEDLINLMNNFYEEVDKNSVTEGSEK
ncbi:GntR family transcriptional regulator [Clostridium sediminicola]|uniref:GntR family transcriptional regulator n=1 Tax=Clostridium sediminicola TaxID=3114879 RepID=UPI0031F228CC